MVKEFFFGGGAIQFHCGDLDFIKVMSFAKLAWFMIFFLSMTRKSVLVALNIISVCCHSDQDFVDVY